MRRPLAVLLLVVVLSVAAPPAGAQGPGDARSWSDARRCLEPANDTAGVGCVALYAHFAGPLGEVALNVGRPPDEVHVANRALGFGSEALWDTNHARLRPVAGLSVYDETGVDFPRDYKIARDLLIPHDVPMWGYWYVSVDSDEVMQPTAGPTAVGAAPCVTVRMTLETGRAPGGGTVLARGETTRTLVSSAGPSGVALPPVPCPGAQPGAAIGVEEVTEFEVLLVPLVDELVVPQNETYIVEVEWFQWDPQAAEGERFYPVGLTVHMGPDMLNRVVLPVQDGVGIESLQVVSLDGNGYVELEVMSPWGDYDVDPLSIELVAFDAAGNEVPLGYLKDPLLRYAPNPQAARDALTVYVPWVVRAEDLPSGLYTLRATVHNWQHTATAEASVPFAVDRHGALWDAAVPIPDDAAGGPDAAAWVASTALGVAAVAVLVFVTLRRRA